MRLDYQNGRSISCEYQQEFGGINHKLRPSDIEFSDAKNLSVREYPVLTTRRERTYLTDIGRCASPSLCVIDSETLAYFFESDDATYICINGERKFKLPQSQSERQMVKMGAFLCVFPDGIVYNIASGTSENVKISVDNSASGFSFTPCGIEGEVASIRGSEPSAVKVGDIWYNNVERKSYLCSGVEEIWEGGVTFVTTSEVVISALTVGPAYAVLASEVIDGVVMDESVVLYGRGGTTYHKITDSIPVVDELTSDIGSWCFLRTENKVYRHEVDDRIWIPCTTSYTKIESTSVDLGSLFHAGDVIEITGCGYTRIYTAVPASEDENGYIVVSEVVYNGTYEKEIKAISLSRNLPEGLTNIVESSNRLWGTDSEGHEIYACKLGDPLNWYAFSGLASDSYSITVGSGGSFTGAISYDGYPHFFKEDRILKVYGNYPFTLYTLECPGVASDSGKSLASFLGALVYKAPHGFYLYDGSYPSCISEPISDICGLKYAVSAASADTNAYYAVVGKSLYIYEKGTWHIHSAPSALDMKSTGRDVVAVFSCDDEFINGSESVPTAYLSSVNGAEYSWAKGKSGELRCSFTAEVIAYADEFGERLILKCDCSKEDFNALSEGEGFFVGENAHECFAQRIFVLSETETGIDFSSPAGLELTESETYKILVFSPNIFEWNFETPLLGLSVPFDKYYSRFVFTYKSKYPVELTLFYNSERLEGFDLPAKKNVGSEVIYSIPARCETIRAAMKGKGEFTLYSFARYIEGGKNP